MGRTLVLAGAIVALFLSRAEAQLRTVPLPGQHDNSHASVVAQFVERLTQLADEVLVERVVNIRPRHREGGDRAIANST